MTTVSDKELSRQFRVLVQTLSMHSMLRDRYKSWAFLLDIALLACAVIFCATTFARSDLFTQAGLSPQGANYILGIASIVAFFASLVALRVDWKGKSARHHDAVQKLASALPFFRESHRDDGVWPEGKKAELHKVYWEATNNVVAIPDGQFVNLKARHLRKVELSKMSSSMPGCPVLILRIILLGRVFKKLCGKFQ